jgi:N-acetylmuramate 1-kinase
VPELLAANPDAGFLLLEDLGGRTLLDTIDSGSADHWFDHAIAQLLRLQAIPCPTDLPAYDETLLRRELALFEEWFVSAHLGLELGGADRTRLQAGCDALVQAALDQPRVLVHRDFMPRNLMPLDDGLAVLDFQDAVRGPIAYDPLCLFKDAFISWPDADVGHWLEHYRSRAAAAGLPVPDARRFRRDTDLIGVQRHLKVLGIFARLHHRDGKPRYLADAPRFIGYLDAVLPRHPELQPLAQLFTTLRPHLAQAVTP